MTNFTPGPWRIAGKNTGYVNGRDTSCRDGQVTVAVVGSYRDKEVLRFSRERWDADTHLIAAAPDLYAALKSLHNNCAEYVHINNLAGAFDNQDMQQARAALAKAEGKPVLPVVGGE